LACHGLGTWVVRSVEDALKGVPEIPPVLRKRRVGPPRVCFLADGCP
jgi:hypothetical protein